jgi:hypothetical protein
LTSLPSGLRGPFSIVGEVAGTAAMTALLVLVAFSRLLLTIGSPWISLVVLVALLARFHMLLVTSALIWHLLLLLRPPVGGVAKEAATMGPVPSRYIS